MDPRLLRYYNQELRYLREMGGEFAREFPKIASRLGLDTLEVSDPYVERLIEGCAFLAARIQLKQDAEFPRFSHRLLELLYPNLLAPLPAMLVAQVNPVRTDPNLASCPELPRDTALLAAPPAHSNTRLELRTSQPLQLTPLQVVHAEYFLNVGDLGLSAHRLPARPRCGVRVRLRMPDEGLLKQLGCDRLRFYLGGQHDVAMHLYEMLVSSTVGVLVGSTGKADSRRMLPSTAVQPVGFADDEALLPNPLRSLSGLRLMQEYLAFPERFLFIDVQGLATHLKVLPGAELELNFLFSRPGQGLDGVVEPANFRLHCVPAINLFTKRADRIDLSDSHHEFHVVPERTAPLDYEVFDVTSLTGYDDAGDERRYLPLFSPHHASPPLQAAYYSLWREPRLVSEQARREGPRSGYIGSEVFISLVDPEEAPVPTTLRQLSVMTRCTNRDLALFLSVGSSNAELSVESGVPLEGAAVISGPSRPYTALREGGVAWRLLNLLSLNYLSLIDSDSDTGGEAAVALRDLLLRLPLGTEPAQRRQIESLQKVHAKACVRRHPVAGPIAFSRGVEVELTVDELGHEGGSAVLFGAVLHHFLSRHASMNSFVQTRLVSLTRGELMTWRPSPGPRTML